MNLVGEGADDAGGVFDETIAQMCEVSLAVLQLFMWIVSHLEHRPLHHNHPMSLIVVWFIVYLDALPVFHYVAC